MNTDVWLCELEGMIHAWEWLCKACALARRDARNGFGALIWLSIRPLRKVDGCCADCEARRQSAPGYVTPTVEVAQIAGAA